MGLTSAAACNRLFDEEVSEEVELLEESVEDEDEAASDDDELVSLEDEDAEVAVLGEEKAEANTGALRACSTLATALRNKARALSSALTVWPSVEGDHSQKFPFNLKPAPYKISSKAVNFC